MKKKRKIIATSLAVVLAVALLAGGTITYLSDSSGTVKNNFNPNEIDVELDESGDQKYEIIPGTSEEKDPTITITSTVDSYLYVLVYGNNPTFTYTGDDGSTVTANIIEYAIAEGWTQLYTVNSDSEGTNDSYDATTLANFDVNLDGLTTTEIKIFYRKVDASDEKQVFHVLENDVVSYSSEITGFTYTDSNGEEQTYKDGEIYLAFAAYAIQQKPFTNAADALTRTVVKTSEGLTEAISNGEPVTLSGDIEVTAANLNTAIADAATKGTTATIDLNGATLTITGNDGIDLNGESLSLSNGTVEYSGSNNVAVAVESGSSLTLDNVTLNVDSSASGATSAINIEGSTNGATLTIRNSTINSEEYYALSTNASTPASSNVTVVIENSTLSTSVCNGDPETTGILFNVPGTLTIKDSTIIGGSQGVIVRGGTANITNSTIKATITGDGADKDSFSTTMGYLNGDNNWSDGNQLPAAALVVGNHSASAYAYETSVTLEDVTLTVGGETETVPAIYAAQSNSSYKTTLTGADSSDTILYYVGSGCNVSVNNTSLSGTGSVLTTVGNLSSTDTATE